jgi:hypothetical protein
MANAQALTKKSGTGRTGECAGGLEA